MSQQRLTRRRHRLWERDPRCRRCRVLTVLPEHLAQFYGLLFDDKLLRHLPADATDIMATIEHKVTRLEDERWNGRSRERTTLYCRRCNQQAARERERRTPRAKREQDREARIWLATQRRYGINLGDALGLTGENGQGQEEGRQAGKDQQGPRPA